MENKTINKNTPWLICFYLCAVYIFFGVLCFLVWQRSELFEVIGWSWSNSGAESLQKVLYSLCAGALGAAAYGFWKLFHHHCSANNFDSKWIVWYIFGPISGSLLGIATYAIVVGGLLVLGESITLRSNWAIFALSFLTGFSAKRVLRKIHAIAGQVFQEEKTSKKTTKCPNCKATVDAEAKYCPSCGNKIKSEE
jgi:hypothetical protein